MGLIPARAEVEEREFFFDVDNTTAVELLSPQTALSPFTTTPHNNDCDS